MTDKEKIRAEIERLKESGCASPIVICDTLLSFIDSMPVEPKFKVGDIVRSNNGTILKIIGIGQYCYYCDNDYSFGFNIQDEFELVEDPDKLTHLEVTKISEQEESVGEKMEKEIINWHLQQMMKDAVDAFIYKGNIRLKEWPLPEKCGKHLDPVKVIIIKEDKV